MLKTNFEILNMDSFPERAYIFIIDLQEYTHIGIYYNSQFMPFSTLADLFSVYLKIYDIGLN